MTALLVLTGTACASDVNDAVSTTSAAPAGSPATTITPLPMGNIVATALTHHVFTELAGLLIDAGLIETLQVKGPFTVFAPTDAAFDKLPLDSLHAVQDDPALLTKVLTNHVVTGAITPADMAVGKLTTVAGTTLTITNQGDTFYVDGFPIGAGVEATNGWVYIMSDVLVPG